jgi:TonB-like protein
VRPFRPFFALPFLFILACGTSPKPKASAVNPVPDAIGCLDTLSAVDTAEAFIQVKVASADTTAKLPEGFAGLFAETLRSHFKPPAKLALSVVMGSEPCDSLGLRCAGGELSLGTTAYVTTYASGKLSEPVIVDESLTPSLADSVRAALDAVSHGQEAPWLGQRDSIQLVITFAPGSDSDSVSQDAVLFKARVPTYDSPFTYAIMPRAGVDAKYPFSATIAGVGDTVTVEFTVLSDGTIAPQSIAIVEASYRDFVTTVLDALLNTRYHAAHLGDCAVATRLKQRFVFNLRK